MLGMMEVDSHDEEKMWPREVETREYLKKHKILELLHNMTSLLIYDRPENPKEYLIEQMEKLLNAKSAKLESPCLFDESNISAVFGMLDPTGQGFITLKQYKEALTTLGVKDFNKNPAGAENNRITVDVFSSEAKFGLVRASSTFVDAKK